MYFIRHIQSSGIFTTLFFSGICWDVQSYSALLGHIHAYWDIIKAYSGFFRHIQHSVTVTYSQPCHILNPSIYRTKVLHLRSLTWSWIHLSLNKYSLTCRVTFCYVYYSKFRHIQAHSRPIRYIQLYGGIFRTLCNSCIFRTLPYSESWHI